MAMENQWLLEIWTVVDLFRRRPRQRLTRNQALGAAIRATSWLDPTETPNYGIKSFITTANKPCEHFHFHYMCPQGSTAANYLYMKCNHCGARWHNWLPGSTKYVEARNVIQHERTLDYEGKERTHPDRARLDSWRWPNED